ncbi:MAG: WecB/TagA/CpsF family glycosyltransferase [Caldilineaceae bacterium]|nr:WecB/TagA/CpsF family glycosyltransferase [Caldilineaceae bacterium]
MIKANQTNSGSFLNKQIKILGTQLSLYSSDELLQIIEQTIVNHEKRLILSGNIHSYNLAYTQPWLQQFINQADVVRLDGAGVRWGAHILGYQTPQRMTWADFAWQLSEFSELHNFSLFFLGGKPGVAERAGRQLKEHNPKLQIVGVKHGYFDKSTNSTENNNTIRTINALSPNILIVGLGMPLQERWLKENWCHLDVNVALTGGAVFDYISGELQRGPKWMTDHNLEWLARLVIEPRRLWKRYILGNPAFFARILMERLSSNR